LQLLDAMFGHNLTESAPWLIASLMQLQALFQDLQHLVASLNARELVTQPRMPAQLATDLDPVALHLGRQGSFRAEPKTDAAGQAAVLIDSSHTIQHLENSFPAGLDTLSASGASIIRYSGVPGLQEPEISDLRPGTPVWASGDADGELIQRLDLPGKTADQKLWPIGVFDDRLEVLLQFVLLEEEVGALPASYAPTELDSVSLSGHEMYPLWVRP